MSSTLPPELEREIFVLAALSWRVSEIPVLLRIAWRIKHWIEPLLYRALVVSDRSNAEGLPLWTCDVEIVDTFIPTAHSGMNAHCQLVRNAMLWSVDASRVNTVLSSCPKIENLFLVFDGEAIKPAAEAFNRLSLKHLYCCLQDLPELTRFDRPFSEPVYAGLTHLELFGHATQDLDMDAAALGLSALAELTHFALSGHLVFRYALCAHMLAESKKLSALVVQSMRVLTLPRALIDDLRFVLMSADTDYRGDWQRGALGRQDYWARADALIAERVAGEEDRSTETARHDWLYKLE